MYVCMCVRVCVIYLTALSALRVTLCASSIRRYWQANMRFLLLSRQIVARGLLDVLREFSDNENDFISVMETVARMSEDGGRCIFLFIY